MKVVVEERCEGHISGCDLLERIESDLLRVREAHTPTRPISLSRGLEFTGVKADFVAHLFRRTVPPSSPDTTLRLLVGFVAFAIQHRIPRTAAVKGEEAELRDPCRVEVEAVCGSIGWSFAWVSTKKGRRGGRR